MNIINCKDKSPLVSVVMPAYNAEKYIRQAVHSVQEQTLQDWELLIVDDFSTDNTLQIACEIADSDHRIRVLKNVCNIGTALSRNEAFSHCEGKYVALLDSDDLWSREKLEKQVQLLEATNADLVYCSYSIIDETGQKKCHDFIVPENATYKTMLTKSVVSCSTALLTKQMIEHYSFSKYFYHEDYVYWLKIFRDGKKIVGTSEVLASYRSVKGTKASNKINSAKNRWLVYKKFCGFSFIKSSWIFINYAFWGILKYRKV